MDTAAINPLVQQAMNSQRTTGVARPPAPQPYSGYAMLPRGGLGGYSAPGQYPFGGGQLPPQFTMQPRSGFGGRGFGSGVASNISRSPPGYGQSQQQTQFPFDLPDFFGSLGNFYTPHNIGDAQNVPNQGAMGNFIGNQWGQMPNQAMPNQQQFQNQYMSSLPRSPWLTSR